MSRDAAVGDVDQPEAIGHLVEDPARVAGPRRRAGQVGRDAARRAGRRAVAGHRVGGRASRRRSPPSRGRSGDHTGPKFSRMPTDLCGIGSNQRSGANAPLPAASSRSSLRPTAPGWCPRGSATSTACSADITTRAAVGRPARAARLRSDAVVGLALLARASRRRCAAADSESRNARREPSGDHEACVVPAPRANCGRSPSGAQVADPQRHRAVSDRTRTRARCRRATTRDWSRRTRRCVSRSGVAWPSRVEHQPQIAERGERDARAIRRDRRDA